MAGTGGGAGGAGTAIITCAMAIGAAAMPSRQAARIAAGAGFLPACDSVRLTRIMRLRPPGSDIDAAGTAAGSPAAKPATSRSVRA